MKVDSRDTLLRAINYYNSYCITFHINRPQYKSRRCFPWDLYRKLKKRKNASAGWPSSCCWTRPRNKRREWTKFTHLIPWIYRIMFSSWTKVIGDRRQLREIASYPVDNDLMNLALKQNILTPFRPTTSSSFRVECESFPIFCPVLIEKRQHLDATEDEAEWIPNSHQLERRIRDGNSSGYGHLYRSQRI